MLDTASPTQTRKRRLQGEAGSSLDEVGMNCLLPLQYTGVVAFVNQASEYSHFRWLEMSEATISVAPTQLRDADRLSWLSNSETWPHSPAVYILATESDLSRSASYFVQGGSYASAASPDISIRLFPDMERPTVFGSLRGPEPANIGITPEVNPLDIDVQLGKLRTLKDGWAEGMQPAIDWGEGHGKAPNHVGLDWLLDQFTRHYPRGISRPYIYPTPEGGVQAEWPLDSNEISLEIDLFQHTAEWHCLNLLSDVSNVEQLNLDDSDSWTWLAKEIRRLESMPA